MFLYRPHGGFVMALGLFCIKRPEGIGAITEIVVVREWFAGGVSSGTSVIAWSAAHYFICRERSMSILSMD